MTSLGLRPILPAGDVSTARTEIKLERMRALGDELDTLFLGSSRAFRGFVPEIFDARAAAGGVPTRSFNFGVPGRRAMELARILERIAASPPPNLRWVFVDPEGFEVLLDERNYLSRDVIDWHDLPTTVLVCEYIQDTVERGREKKIRMHLISCVYNLVGVGRGLRWADALLGVRPSDEELAATLGPRGDGFAPFDTQQHWRFRKQREEYGGWVEEVASLETSPGPAAPQALAMFRRIQERVEALGATAIFVIQPSQFLQHDLIKAGAAGEVHHLVRYDDPDAFPELFAFEQRRDFNHPNSTGARLFTERLAADFLEIARSEKRE